MYLSTLERNTTALGALVILALSASAMVKAPRDASNFGLSRGGNAPEFELTDQTGKKRTLSSLMGPRGLVLVFFRSADW